ncbi:hypothetical protein [Phaffia rhodozyma]|uniref:Uncharacterized protein n=1 Tax=Phaffia rhodozyma TaxID=264483 RepID=A0A0F7SN96_PHARH|nr:hypothetical protein [Phaffia rhodozyma]
MPGRWMASGCWHLTFDPWAASPTGVPGDANPEPLTPLPGSNHRGRRAEERSSYA